MERRAFSGKNAKYEKLMFEKHQAALGAPGASSLSIPDINFGMVMAGSRAVAMVERRTES